MNWPDTQEHASTFLPYTNWEQQPTNTHHIQEFNKIKLLKWSAGSNPTIKNPFAVVSKEELVHAKF